MKNYENLNVTLVNNLRKKIEELNQSSERFRAIFEGDRNGILVADAGTMKFISANPAICRMIGYTENELLQFDISKIHPKKDLPHVIEQFTKQLNGEIDIAENLPVLRKDGTIFFCDVNAVPMQISSKAVLVGFFNDITERKKSEEKIKENEEKYRVLYESSSDAIMMLAPPNWNFTSCNRATITLFKSKDEKEFVSKTPGEISPKYQPDGQLSTAKAKKMIMKAMKEGSNFFEWTHKRINGEDFSATVLLTRIKLNGKEQLQATVRDVTTQKNTENTLRGSELRYKHLFDSIPFMSQSVTPDAKISYVNKKWKDVLGYGDKDIKKLNLWKLIHKSEHAHCKKLFIQVMSGKHLSRIKTVFVAKSGKQIPVYGTIMPIMENGKVIATDAIFWKTKR